ncbi:hypothetical protein PACTADRAFT_184776 [Pachysolen tannophilus NRRL Y-2460]|uniref:Amino acid permease/ SLC12A domain-containing protein n=1 Tax=Pachysolen tannophilus NRRL Y-2460 TaxID=669874 RepID=A0A1E4U3N8_PACTA|nr:hypothetical protein PACTADRAFT_184776 [Pachysolen tannophilus NRRL Y-2460]
MSKSKLKNFLYDHLVPLPPAKSTTAVLTTTVEQDEKENSQYVVATGIDRYDKGDYQFRIDTEVDNVASDSSSTLIPSVYTTRRNLKNRHVQLIGIGGTIGTALFVSIGTSLYEGGPLSLLLSFAIWCIPVFFVTLCTAEMVCFLPTTSPFITLTGILCDEALEFMQGFNFWVLQGALIPFEISGVHTIIEYWNSTHNPGIELGIQLGLYFIISMSAVSYYGETEFWLSIGKVILAAGLMLFTFFTMVGANPHRDAYGFRNWNEPSPMVEYLTTGNLGRFQGFLACLIQASFTIAGPDYVASVAGEIKGEVRKKNLPKAFKQVFFRLTFMFIGGALCVGIVCSSRDSQLISAISESRPGAGSSPYVIAMKNLDIPVLPDIVNALLVLSAFSAGNSYTYCTSRTLYGLAKNGKTPKFLTHCTKNGVPMYCVLISLCWGLLSLLELGTNSSIVLDWIINLVTQCQLLNYFLICSTYCFFYKALKYKGIDRKDLYFRAWYQPYLAILGAICFFSMIFINPYLLYYPSKEYWSLETFLFSFLLLFVDAALYIGYKIIFRTKWRKVSEVNFDKYLKEIEDYEEAYLNSEEYHIDNKDKKQARYWYHRFLNLIVGDDD